MAHHHKDRSARILARLLNVEPGEAPAVATGLVTFFLLFTGYFIFRPVRETMGVAAVRKRCSGFLPAPSWRPWRSSRSLAGWLRRFPGVRSSHGPMGFSSRTCLGLPPPLPLSGQSLDRPGLLHLALVFNLLAVSLAWSVAADIFASSRRNASLP